MNGSYLKKEFKKYYYFTITCYLKFFNYFMFTFTLHSEVLQRRTLVVFQLKLVTKISIFCR